MIIAEHHTCAILNGRVRYWSRDMIESPCVDVCKLDSDFVCVGCGRTIEEVLKWPEYDETERQAVLDRLFDGTDNQDIGGQP